MTRCDYLIVHRYLYLKASQVHVKNVWLSFYYSLSSSITDAFKFTFHTSLYLTFSFTQILLIIVLNRILLFCNRQLVSKRLTLHLNTPLSLNAQVNLKALLVNNIWAWLTSLCRDRPVNCGFSLIVFLFYLKSVFPAILYPWSNEVVLVAANRHRVLWKIIHRMLFSLLFNNWGIFVFLRVLNRYLTNSLSIWNIIRMKVVWLVHHSEIFQHTWLVQVSVTLEVLFPTQQLHNLNIRIQISRMTTNWFILLGSLRCMYHFIRSWPRYLIKFFRLWTFIQILRIFIVEGLFKSIRIAAFRPWML